LECSGSQPNPAAPNSTGGNTFDSTSNGSAPGSAGLYISSNAGGAYWAYSSASIGATNIVIVGVAITHETITIAGHTYTVLSASEPIGQIFPDALTISPGLVTPIVGNPEALDQDSGTTVTINPTVTTPNRTVNDAVYTNDSANITSATAAFTAGDNGSAVSASWNNGGTWQSATQIPSVTATASSGGSIAGTGTDSYQVVYLNGSNQPQGESAVVTVPVVTGDQVTIAYPAPPGGDTASVYGRSGTLGLLQASASNPYVDAGSSTPGAAVPLDSVTILTASGTNATLSQPVYTTHTGDLTIGDIQEASAQVYGDINVQETGCFTTLPPGEIGVIAPQYVNVIGHNLVSNANAALALEAFPPNFTASLQFPTLSAGWCDKNGTSCVQPQATLNFTGGTKYDHFLLLSNAYTYDEGLVTGGDYTDAGEAQMGLQAYGVDICSAAQQQAINFGTGPDAGSIPQGSSALVYCDGGSSSSTTPAEALATLIVLELNPSASSFGSDGSELDSLYQLDSGPFGTTIF